MPEMNVYKQAAVVWNDTQIKCVESISIDQRIEAFLNRSGGSPWATFASGRKRIPLFSFETYDIAAILTLTSLFPVAVASAKTGDFYFAKRLHGNHIDPASVHRKYAVNHGILIPRRFSVDDRGEWKASVDVIATYDGTNNPITTSDNNALPAGITTACNKYTLGPWKLATTLYDIQSSEIDCGIKEFTDGKNGEPYDRFACMDTQELKASMKTRDLTISTVTGFDGTGLATTIFMRKLLANSTARVADATAQHISIAFASAFVYPTRTEGSGDAASQGVDAIAVWNGVAAIGVVSQTAAIA